MSSIPDRNSHTDFDLLDRSATVEHTCPVFSTHSYPFPPKAQAGFRIEEPYEKASVALHGAAHPSGHVHTERLVSSEEVIRVKVISDPLISEGGFSGSAEDHGS